MNMGFMDGEMAVYGYVGQFRTTIFTILFKIRSLERDDAIRLAKYGSNHVSTIHSLPQGYGRLRSHKLQHQ